MTSVSGTGSPVVPSLPLSDPAAAPQAAVGTQAPNNNGTSGAFYTQLGFQTLFVDPLNALGDVDVVATQAMLTENDAEVQTRAARAASMLAVARTLSADLLNANSHIQQLTTVNAALTQQESTAQTQLSTDQQTLTSATNVLNAAVSNQAFWVNQVATINPNTDPTGFANAVQQSALATTQVDTAQAAVNTAIDNVNSDKSVIAGFETQIAANNDTIVGLQNTLPAIQNQFVAAVAATQPPKQADSLRALVVSKQFKRIATTVLEIASTLQAQDVTAAQYGKDHRDDTVKENFLQRFQESAAQLTADITALLNGSADPQPAERLGNDTSSQSQASRVKILL